MFFNLLDTVVDSGAVGARAFLAVRLSRTTTTATTGRGGTTPRSMNSLFGDFFTKMFLHLIFARVFSFKHFGWLQKIFLLIDLRPCFHFDDLLERFSIHLHYESNQSIE